MTALMDRVCKEALELPIDQRLTVVHRILEQSDESSVLDDSQREWTGVICERMSRYDSGQVKTRPASEVLDELEKRLDE